MFRLRRIALEAAAHVPHTPLDQLQSCNQVRVSNMLVRGILIVMAVPVGGEREISRFPPSTWTRWSIDAKTAVPRSTSAGGDAISSLANLSVIASRSVDTNNSAFVSDECALAIASASCAIRNNAIEASGVKCISEGG